MSRVELAHHIDLAEFVADYLAIDGEGQASDHDIAVAYCEATAADCTEEPDFRIYVAEIEKALPYYTSSGSKTDKDTQTGGTQ